MNRALSSGLFSAALACAGALTSACSSDSVPDTGGGGGASSAGAGGAGGAMPARGNLTLIVQPTTTPAKSCPVSGKTYVVGNPSGPNSGSPGDRLVDGMGGAKITCSVTGSGPYTVYASIRGQSSENEVVMLTIANGVVNADKQTGSAAIAVYTPQLAGTFGANECTLSVVDQNVKPGALWATVSCPTISDPSLPGSACSVGPTTTFVLENCDGS